MTTCPVCDSNNIATAGVPHVIPILKPHAETEYTSAVLPVLSCRDCGQTWMGSVAAKDAAVRKHLAKGAK